jgi:hypothetical protein
VNLNKKKALRIYEAYKTYEHQERDKILHESRMNLIQSDVEIYKKIDKARSSILNSSIKHTQINNSNESVILKKYEIIEMLTGLHIIRKENKLDSFEIVFQNLLDNCLDSDLYFDKYPPLLKKRMSELSADLLDSYRSIFKVNNDNNINKNHKSDINLFFFQEKENKS